MSDLYKTAEANREQENLVWEAKVKNALKSAEAKKVTNIMCQAVDDDRLFNHLSASGTPYYVHEVALQGLYDAGYVVVPAEPTEDMIQAGQDCFEGCHYDACSDASKHIWADMIDYFK